MKFDRRMVAAILLMSVFAPAVNADLVTDPKEFAKFKKQVEDSTKPISHEKDAAKKDADDKKKESDSKKETDKQEVKAEKKSSSKSSKKTIKESDAVKVEHK